MKMFAASVFLMWCASILLAGPAENGSLPGGPYLGQKPPGETPEIFAPGIVSGKIGVYANVTFDASLTRACWTLNTDDPEYYHGGLIFSELDKGAWTAPKEIFFMNDQYGHRSPFFDYAGKRLYFQAYLKSALGWDQQERFYYVERTNGGWSAPVLLDPIFDKYMVHWQFSMDLANNMYFGGELRGREKSGGIYLAKYQNGRYQEPELIFGNESFKDFVFGPAVSPQGDYIVFARLHPRESTNPRVMSLYASFRGEDGSWSEPRELGELLNMEGNQARISPDGRFIFFVRNDGMAYWVSARIIERLRPQRPSMPEAVDKIAFYSTRSGTAQICVMNAGGSDQRRLTNDPGFDGAPSWGVIPQSKR
jgi:hypothetical protein